MIFKIPDSTYLIANNITNYTHITINNSVYTFVECGITTVGEDIYLVGIDALSEAIENVMLGNMTGTVFNDYISQSRSTVDAAINYLTGKENEHYIACDYLKVTQDNVQDFLDMLN